MNEKCASKGEFAGVVNGIALMLMFWRYSGIGIPSFIVVALVEV